MSDIVETRLPGIGIRYEFVTATGVRTGVLAHRGGRRDVLVYSRTDPSACDLTLELDADEARTLAELLGASRVAQELVAVQQEIEGLAIDWVRIHDDAAWAGQTLGEAGVHTRTGVAIVAITGPNGAIPAPGARDVLVPGATVVAVGNAEGIERLVAKLQGP